MEREVSEGTNTSNVDASLEILVLSLNADIKECLNSSIYNKDIMSKAIYANYGLAHLYLMEQICRKNLADNDTKKSFNEFKKQIIDFRDNITSNPLVSDVRYIPIETVMKRSYIK